MECGHRIAAEPYSHEGGPGGCGVARLRSKRILIVLGISTALVSGAAAEEKPVATPAGSSLFKTYCAACHGTQAKGDGPLASSLRVVPPDLTLLAKRSGGAYPTEQVYRVIDGRTSVKGHGGPDMPVWGDAFKASADGYSEEKVKEKIDALVDFLKSIQMKTS